MRSSAVQFQRQRTVAAAGVQDVFVRDITCESQDLGPCVLGVEQALVIGGRVNSGLFVVVRLLWARGWVGHNSATLHDPNWRAMIARVGAAMTIP